MHVTRKKKIQSVILQHLRDKANFRSSSTLKILQGKEESDELSCNLNSNNLTLIFFQFQKICIIS